MLFCSCLLRIAYSLKFCICGTTSWGSFSEITWEQSWGVANTCPFHFSQLLFLWCRRTRGLCMTQAGSCQGTAPKGVWDKHHLCHATQDWDRKALMLRCIFIIRPKDNAQNYLVKGEVKIEHAKERRWLRNIQGIPSTSAADNWYFTPVPAFSLLLFFQ